VGGGLSVLEVFYITSIVSLPAFYLGPLLAAEGAGLALGVSLAGGLPSTRAPRIGIILGLVSSGGALALLVLLPDLPIVLLVALGLGLANALAVSAARNALILRFDGIERRALASGEQWMTALCGVAGALLFTLFFTGPQGVPIHLPSNLLPSWPLPALLLLTAGGLAAAGPLVAVASPPSGRRRLKRGRKKGGKKAKPGASSSRVPMPRDDDFDDSPAADDSAYLPATGAHAAWDGEAGDDSGDWDEGYSEQYPAQRTGYGQAYDTGSYDAYGDEADPRSGPPARRPAPRRNRPRW
jgi:MFS family permease